MKEEALSEADHKAYCSEELKSNKLKRDEHEATIARLLSHIEEKSVAVDQMAKEISLLVQEQAASAKDMHEATAKRVKEKEANAVTIKDAEVGQAALKQAILVLKAFYSEQGGEFMQISNRRLVPELERYRGMHQGGVIAMLEVIEGDFARLKTDTMASERQAVAEYNQFMADVEAANKAEFERDRLQKDLESSQAQLKMAKAYYAELKPQCIMVQVSHKERQARREEEIVSLKEAYKILAGTKE